MKYHHNLMGEDMRVRRPVRANKYVHMYTAVYYCCIAPTDSAWFSRTLAARGYVLSLGERTGAMGYDGPGFPAGEDTLLMYYELHTLTRSYSCDSCQFRSLPWARPSFEENVEHFFVQAVLNESSRRSGGTRQLALGGIQRTYLV